MIDPDEIRWVKSTANELNNLLHVISESGQALKSLSSGNPDADKYLGMLRSAVDRATHVTAEMVMHVGGLAPVVAAPAPKPQPKPAAKSSRKIEVFNPGGSRELLMIVDDEEIITELAKEVLTGAGYRVLTAKDGFEALDIYREMHPEIALVLLDFTMPVMDGADVFEELREINPDATVVLSSGFTEPERLRGMLTHGLRGFIPKPYTQQKLLDQVRATLDGVCA